jgi:hypothetical protein
VTLRLGAPLVLLALLVGATAASAGPTTPTSPPPGPLSLASRDDPQAGHPFVGYVVVLPASARRGLVGADARCHGTVLGRTVPGRASRVPEGARLPSALVCTWAIPADRVGWTFRGRVELDLQRRLANGGVEILTDEGRITRWTVQP